MNLIDFADNFHGFEEGEDILIDTGILFAYYNEYDAYYDVVNHLFQNHVFHDTASLFLYVNPTIVNEISHLAKDPFRQYTKARLTEPINLTPEDAVKMEDIIIGNIKQLIENQVLLVLDGDDSSVLKQLELYKKLGSADAVNASIANLFGTSFLTVDFRLANNMQDVKHSLSNVQNIYYTTGRYRSYYTKM